MPVKEEGSVRALYVFRVRGQPGESVEEAEFISGAGMTGDRHADGGTRQVTLLPAETRDWMNRQKMEGLCFRRYKANIETEGLDTDLLKPGTMFAAGTAVFRVSESGKECFDDCPLFQKGEGCRLSSGGIFLAVVRTGKVSIKDQIKIGGVYSETIRER